MTNEQYLARHITRTKRLEAKYLRPMVEALDQQVRAFVSVLRRFGVVQAQQESIPDSKVTSLIRDIYENVGLFYARKTLREIAADIENKAGFGLNEELITKILEYLFTNLLRDVASITQTTKDSIFEIIKQGQNEGWGIDRMAKEIVQADIPMARARMIIRTELVKAMGAGQQAAKNESAFETVDQWISAHDHRVRHSHRQIDGAKVREGELFAVRKRKGGYDMMTGPGDPTASAENVINCRCAKVTRVRRDENGVPIRKRKIFVALPHQVRRPQIAKLV